MSVYQLAAEIQRQMGPRNNPGSMKRCQWVKPPAGCSDQVYGVDAGQPASSTGLLRAANRQGGEGCRSRINLTQSIASRVTNEPSQSLESRSVLK